MEQLKGIGPGRKTTLYLDTSLAELARIAPPHHSILVVDEQVLSYHAAALEAWPKILLPSGEAAKSLSVLEQAVAQLTSLEAGRDCTLVSIGGGVVSDFTGFLLKIPVMPLYKIKAPAVTEMIRSDKPIFLQDADS